MITDIAWHDVLLLLFLLAIVIVRWILPDEDD